MSKRTLCCVPGCNRQVKARSLCMSHYNRKYRSGKLPPLQKSIFDHSLTEIDREARTALCSICGPVSIRVHSRGRGCECRNKLLEQRKKERLKQRKERPELKKSRPRGPKLSGPDRWRKQKYGLNPEDYQRMVEEQGGLCAICSAPVDRLFVDHCHQTGRVRGLLCNSCNSALGLFRDDVVRMRKAIEYLNP